MADCVVSKVSDGITDQESTSLTEQTVDNLNTRQSTFLGFTGCYTHGIDTKGRVIVPACYREALGESFVAALTVDRKAIALYPTPEWIRQRDIFKTLSEKDARMIPVYNYMCKYSFPECETDNQGRVLLPAKLRSKVLMNAQNAELSGAGNYVRIVEASAGEAEDEAIFANIPDILSFIAEIQNR